MNYPERFANQNIRHHSFVGFFLGNRLAITCTFGGGVTSGLARLHWEHAKKPLLVFICLLLVFCLHGCGTRQTGGLEVSAPKVIPKEEGHASLTGPEMAAFKTTGQIDKNVPDEAMEDIALQYKHFLRKGRQTMCVFSRQSEPYLAYARKVFRERGMPEELANLAIVESGYRPDAQSRAGAAGAWQFIPSTGVRYGLTQNQWLDERLDPYKSTEAAADYLKKLYNDFGDWPTAIAAYNAGEGKMSRAKMASGGKDFFEVKARNHELDEKTQLREETKQYVPRFMAITKIMRNLPELGFDAINPEKSDKITRFTVKPGTDLAAMSKACNMSWDEFKAYNRHHKNKITCTDQKTFIYVPSKAEKQAHNYLCSSNVTNFEGWKFVKVANGKDSLEKISKRAKVPLTHLRAANPGVQRLKAGQMVLVPGGADMSARAVAAVQDELMQKTGLKLKNAASRQAALATMDKPAAGQHVLQSSETLYAVARKYNINPVELQRHNGINDPAKMRVGQILKIPGKAAPAKGKSRGSIGSRKSTYTVRAKDNLWSIAKKHNITVEDLKRWNNVNEKSLRPGADLVVAEE